MGHSDAPISSLKSLILDLPPSCVEFSPANPSYFLVGTYNLQQSHNSEDGVQQAEEVSGGEEGRVVGTTQRRDGSIIVFRMIDDTVVLVQTEIQPSAVLDLHFQLSSAKQNICAAVSSTASLAIFSFFPEMGTQQPLSLLRTVRIPTVGDEVLFLSFAWHPYMQDVVAVTTSTGHVQLLRLGAGYDTCAVTSDPILTHSLETWCVAFIRPVELRPPQGSNGDEGHEQLFMLLSGGDDSTLRYADCMMKPALDATELNLTVEIPYPVAKMGGHDAGVTAILPLELTTGTSELVVTGSYDDHIRLFAIEPLQNSNGIRRTRKLAEQNLGGGVWRLKLVDTTTSVDGWRATILASCMHAGTRIVELTSKAADDYYFEVLGRFEEHKSMNYGSDVQPGNVDTLRCISTSFYDKLLCLWEFRTST